MTLFAAIFCGVVTLVCIGLGIWLLTLGVWQAAIPLAVLAAIFGYMTIRDIVKLRR